MGAVGLLVRFDQEGAAEMSHCILPYIAHILSIVLPSLHLPIQTLT